MSLHLKHRLLHLVGLRDPEHPWVVRAQRWRRKILQTDERIRSDYFQKTARPKLHIGGGWHRLDGWLNTDLGLVPGVMVMDAIQDFPFAAGTFEYIYTEHMIEHVSYEQGAYMLRECHRVMHKGGVIRVTTPDLAVITGLCTQDLSDVQRRYLSWFYPAFIPEGCPRTPAIAINAFFRMWGHQFLYDEETLRGAMQAAGFGSIRRLRLGHSDHPELQKLENQQRYPEGLLDFESVALEGRKAGDAPG
jgi:predicted SAM-dependent methyltransferase